MSATRRGALAAFTALAGAGRPAAGAAPALPALPGQDLALAAASRRTVAAYRAWLGAMMLEADATDLAEGRTGGSKPSPAVRAAAEAEAARQETIAEASQLAWAEAATFLAETPASGAIGLAAKILPLGEAEEFLAPALKSEEIDLLLSAVEDADRLLAALPEIAAPLPKVAPAAPAADAELLRLAERAIEAKVRWHAAHYPDAETDEEEQARAPGQARLDAISAAARAELLARPARSLAGCIAKARAVFVHATYNRDGSISAWDDAEPLLLNLLEDLLALGGTDPDAVLRDALRHAEGVPGADAMFGELDAGGAA